MKKIAFYVEGQTEQFFINKLLIEIAGRKNIAIELKKFGGKNNVPTNTIFPKSVANASHPQYSALIYDCGGDTAVKPRILDDYATLMASGYVKIIGIRDLFPLTDLLKLENYLKFGNGTNIPPLPDKSQIIVAVHEIEAWFLSEFTHFSKLDDRLTTDYIKCECGIDPCIDDMTLLPNPAVNMKEIYELVGKHYTKNKKHVEHTVECLDYANIYLTLRSQIAKLNELIVEIDVFLSRDDACIVCT